MLETVPNKKKYPRHKWLSASTKYKNNGFGQTFHLTLQTIEIKKINLFIRKWSVPLTHNMHHITVYANVTSSAPLVSTLLLVKNSQQVIPSGLKGQVWLWHCSSTYTPDSDLNGTCNAYRDLERNNCYNSIRSEKNTIQPPHFPSMVTGYKSLRLLHCRCNNIIKESKEWSQWALKGVVVYTFILEHQHCYSSTKQ